MVQTRGKPPANADGPTMTVTTSTSTYTKRNKRGEDGVKYRRERVDEVPVKNTTNQPPAAIEQPPSRPQFASVQPPVLFAPPVLHSYSSMSSKSTINNHNPAQVVVTTLPHHTDLGSVFRAQSTNTHSQQGSGMLPESAMSCQQVMSIQTLTPRDQKPVPCFDMSLTKQSEQGLRFQVRNCVKEKIFPKVKFLDKDVHGIFDTGDRTVCRTLLDYCFHYERADLKDARDWWVSARPWVFKTHTDARNNAIKGMKISYTSKLSATYCRVYCHSHYSSDCFYMQRSFSSSQPKEGRHCCHRVPYEWFASTELQNLLVGNAEEHDKLCCFPQQVRSKSNHFQTLEQQYSGRRCMQGQSSCLW